MNSRHLKLLSSLFPDERSTEAEIVRLHAALRLPKGTELFLSDIHGEDEAFVHLLSNASGVIYEKIETVFGASMTEEDRRSFASLIYYPREKIPEAERASEDTAAWYALTLARLATLCRAMSEKYTREGLRAAMTGAFHPVLEELLLGADLPAESPYRDRVIAAAAETGNGARLAGELCALIKRLAVARLHIVGDIYDRGPRADLILDALKKYHSADVQWGNHDILWMGAAAGSAACVAAAVRMCIGYGSLDMLENGYGISLLPLALFAEETYGKAERFMPQVLPGGLRMPHNPELYARMNKAISVIQYKLEGELVRRRPEFGMADRDMLGRVDWRTGMIDSHGRLRTLLDSDFPTVNPEAPNELTNREYALIGQLVDAFARSEKLQAHVRFLYRVGSIYLKYNGNLLFHGCIPLTEEGELMSFNLGGRTLSGQALLNYCDRMARQGYFSAENSAARKQGRDFLWFLWCGRHSPLFGRNHMATFERALLQEKETWEERQNAYYRWNEEERVIGMIFREFGLERHWSRIINGHVPVRVSKGEDPRKADGRLIVIDGGFCKAYQKKTGIAGYTMFFSSRGIRIASHEPFTSRAEAICGNLDITSHSLMIEDLPDRLMVSDTDEGDEIRRRIKELEELRKAYRRGRLKTGMPSLSLRLKTQTKE